MMMHLSFIVLLAIVAHLISPAAPQQIKVQHPGPNQQVSYNSIVPVEYHVQRVDHYQEGSSVDVVLQWQQIDQQGNAGPLQTNVHHGLSARAHRGLEDLFYYQWKTPGCHFFIRYPPAQFNFTMVFLPSNATQSPTVQIPLDFSPVFAPTTRCQIAHR
ncbi:hypothetical protein BC940DRAFT_295205 [Gongronella butleri]|nr:hypothetical protein BC940DRAFT_295205 [Gongronella butleri]